MTEPAKFDYDVFISYSSKDKTWVRGELLKRIEQAGLKAFIDFRDFTAGAPSISECERGVVKCRKTLLVLTPNYIASGWTEIENIMVQTLDPANHGLRLIPLLKADCKKPLRIGALTYIDFTDGEDNGLAWRQLLTALGKPPEPEPAKMPQRDDWFLAHPYPMPPNFTGRVAERKMLSHWMDEDSAHPMLVLRALGGFGKSALVWHWLTHDVAAAKWPRVVWWSFYEGDASFDHFLADTLFYLGAKEAVLKSLPAHEQVEKLLELLHKPGTLLVLDGFERILRGFGGLNAAYQGDDVSKTEANERDCISPLAEFFLRGVATLPNIRAKILLTSRLHPRAVEDHGALLDGCRETELVQMQADDAVEFFRTQGIRGTHKEIKEACEPYGYHPLSLRLLAGLVVGDFQQPGDIAAAKQLDVSGDLVQRQHHVLETAYNSLTPMRQALLGRIACFRSPVKYDALKAIAETDSTTTGQTAPRSRRRKEADEPAEMKSGTEVRLLTSAATGGLDTDLRDLVARGLLHYDTKDGRFDLHPIVRRYAYDRLPNRRAVHKKLVAYFRLLAEKVTTDHVKTVSDLMPMIELYFHTARAGRYGRAWLIYREQLNKALYMQFCVYQTCIELLSELLPRRGGLPQLKSREAQGILLNLLSSSHRYLGQPHAAIIVYSEVQSAARFGGLVVTAVRLGNIARSHMALGEFRSAMRWLKQSIELCNKAGQKFSGGERGARVGRFWESEVAEFWKSVGQSKLAFLLATQGAFQDAERHLMKAQTIFQGVEGQYHRLIASAKRALLMSQPEPALNLALSAWDLKDKVGKGRPQDLYHRERDLIRAEWMLGAALVASADCSRNKKRKRLDEAEVHLVQALKCCRRINMVDHEANILIDLARLRAATGVLDEAQRLAEEALLITERSGYVLQGADARLELAKLALARGDKATAKEHAQEARRLATCDGPPDYTYKAAYDEAGALLAELK